MLTNIGFVLLGVMAFIVIIGVICMICERFGKKEESEEKSIVDLLFPIDMEIDREEKKLRDSVSVIARDIETLITCRKPYTFTAVDTFDLFRRDVMNTEETRLFLAYVATDLERLSNSHSKDIGYQGDQKVTYLIMIRKISELRDLCKKHIKIANNIIELKKESDAVLSLVSRGFR